MDDVAKFDARIRSAEACFKTKTPITGRLKGAALLLAKRKGIAKWEAAGQVLDMAEAGESLTTIEKACRGPG